jgi:endonuclease III
MLAPTSEISSRRRAQIVRRVCEQLKAMYGEPRLGNPEDPLDDLTYVLLSNKTQPIRAQTAFSKIKEKFPAWREVMEADPTELISILKPTGFAVKRTTQIQAILRKIDEDFGALSLDQLRSREEAEVLHYLRSLHGVSDKVARCVMMYTLGFKVLPVDVHVHRVAQRLGWTRKNHPEQAHDELEELIPPNRRYAFHVDCVAHGRALCKPLKPICAPCGIKKHCQYFLQVMSKGREI